MRLSLKRSRIRAARRGETSPGGARFFSLLLASSPRLLRNSLKTYADTCHTLNASLHRILLPYSASLLRITKSLLRVFRPQFLTFLLQLRGNKDWERFRLHVSCESFCLTRGDRRHSTITPNKNPPTAKCLLKSTNCFSHCSWLVFGSSTLQLVDFSN